MRRIPMFATIMLVLLLTVPSFAYNSGRKNQNRSGTSTMTSADHRAVWRIAQAARPTANDGLRDINQRLNSHRRRVADYNWQKYQREREKRLRAEELKRQRKWRERERQMKAEELQRQRLRREKTKRSYRNPYQKTYQPAQKYQSKKAKHQRRRETADLKLELVDPPQDSLLETDVAGDGLLPLKTYIEQVETPKQ